MIFNAFILLFMHCTYYNFIVFELVCQGLIPALQEMFPVAEHRYCLKHIYDNMKLEWRGQQFKELLWRCATSPTVQLFEKNMDEIRRTNKELYDWLKLIPPQHWSRSHFSGKNMNNINSN